MFGATIVIEESRYNHHGYTNIRWYCRGCGHIMDLPQQQNFSYCFHCSRKVIRKVGGEVEI